MIKKFVHFMRSLTEFEKNVVGVGIALIGFSGFSAGITWCLLLPLGMAFYIMVHVLIKQSM